MNDLTYISEGLSQGALVSLTVPVAAAHVLAAWSADQEIKAAHESSHLLVATHLRFPCTAVDLRGRHCAWAEIDTDVDTVPEMLTTGRVFDRIVVDLAGRAGEIELIGQPTTGSAADLEQATNRALLRVAAGADPGAPLISYRSFGGFGSIELPSALRDEIAASVVATLRDCSVEAERIVSEHRDQLIALAKIVARDRRLSDEPLRRALLEVGLDPVPVRP